MEKDDVPLKVESFVWNAENSDCKNSSLSTWRIDSIRSSKIFDSDPHSLKEKSHVAWKNELNLTRFANQELPEALWGSNWFGVTHLPTGVRISFCALEGLRVWTLMEEEGHDDNNNNNHDDVDALSIIIPHLSGRIPDPWDYTYTTNYAGSVERIASNKEQSTCKTPDGQSLYSIKIAQCGSTYSSRRKVLYDNKSQQTTQSMSAKIVRPSTLVPPMCKCVGGRMICAGIAKNLTSSSSSSEQKKYSSFSSLQGKSLLPQPSPKWIPVDNDDEIFDMENLLNSQSLPPLYYTNQIPLWKQNLDPHSYSFLTVSALVLNDTQNTNNDKLTRKGVGSCLAILLRNFVRVNGVRVRVIDTKFIIRRRKQKRCQRQRYKDNNSVGIDDNNDDEVRNDDCCNKFNDNVTPMVVMRERSWKEGTWDEYVGKKKTNSYKKHNGGLDANDIEMIDLGNDIEQGQRASRNLPHKFIPIVEKLVLYADDDDDDNEDDVCNGDKEDHYADNLSTTMTTNANTSNQQPTIYRFAPKACITIMAEWFPSNHLAVSVEEKAVITSCSIGSGLILLVFNRNTLVALDYESGDFLWEKQKISDYSGDKFSLLSVTAQESVRSQNSKNDVNDELNTYNNQKRILVGDDQGGVHILECCKENYESKSFSFSNNVDRGKKTTSTTSRKKPHIASCWIEKVTWSNNGQHFAAASGKKVMINGKIIEVGGTVYGLLFLKRNSLAVAIYGGLIIIDIESMKIWNRRFLVGSSAVLSFSVTKDERSIGIGCLDKRLRIYTKRSSHNNNINDDDEKNDDWSVRDWIGFDGGVSYTSYSKDNNRLAALGGTILLIIERSLYLGESPIICTCDGKLKSFAWITNNILVASTEKVLHVFDVLQVVETVPKQCHPFESIPIEKGYATTDVEGELLVWGKTMIRKLKVS